MEVIKNLIYLEEFRNEYVVALPHVVSIRYISPEDNVPNKAPLVVAVYRPTGRRYGTSFDFSHEYEFVGVEIR